MSKKKEFKARVKARRRKTGETHSTAARRLRGRVSFRRLVDEVIELAKAARNESTILHDRADVPMIEEMLMSQPEHRSRHPREWELRDRLGATTEFEARALEALMYAGRDREDPAWMYQYLTGRTEDRDDAIRTMLEKVPLADYLIRGLRLARERCFDIETLPLLGQSSGAETPAQTDE